MYKYVKICIICIPFQKATQPGLPSLHILFSVNSPRAWDAVSKVALCTVGPAPRHSPVIPASRYTAFVASITLKPVKTQRSFKGGRAEDGRSLTNFLGQVSDVRAWLRSPPCMRTFSKSNGFASKEPTAPGPLPQFQGKRNEGNASQHEQGKRLPVKAPAEILMSKGDVFSLVPPVARYHSITHATKPLNKR